MTYYDYEKLMVFCVLYCNADSQVKCEYLFDIMSDKKLLLSSSIKTETVLIYITIISCIINAEFLRAVSKPALFYFARQISSYLFSRLNF